MRAFAPGLLAAALLLGGQPVALADCECRANGRLYRHGELACLRLPTGDQLARCDMVLNNSAWKKVRDGCPEANAGDIDRRIDGKTGGWLPIPGGEDEASPAAVTASG